MTVQTIKIIINSLKEMYLEESKNLPESILFWTTDDELIAAIKAEALSELETAIENTEKYHKHLNAILEGREKIGEYNGTVERN